MGNVRSFKTSIEQNAVKQNYEEIEKIQINKWIWGQEEVASSTWIWSHRKRLKFYEVVDQNDVVRGRDVTVTSEHFTASCRAEQSLTRRQETMGTSRLWIWSQWCEAAFQGWFYPSPRSSHDIKEPDFPQTQLRAGRHRYVSERYLGRNSPRVPLMRSTNKKMFVYEEPLLAGGGTILLPVSFGSNEGEEKRRRDHLLDSRSDRNSYYKKWFTPTWTTS